MNNHMPQDHKLSVNIVHDLLMFSVFEILGSSKSPLIRWCQYWLLFLPVRYFSKFFIELDEQVENNGAPAAGRWLANRFVDDIRIQGFDNIPKEGPIMVVSNHPGAYDSFCILASMGREDLNAIISDIRVFMELPHVASHLIYTNEKVEVRMLAIREAIKRLQDGQSFLIFPTGLIDPDPSFMEGVYDELMNWSNSVELFLRRAPETQLVVTTVSHVLQPKWMKNPLLRTQKTEMTKRRMAEFIQVLNQFFIPWSIKSTPCITFGKAISYTELKKMDGSIRENIIRLAAIQMESHMEKYNKS